RRPGSPRWDTSCQAAVAPAAARSSPGSRCRCAPSPSHGACEDGARPWNATRQRETGSRQAARARALSYFSNPGQTVVVQPALPLEEMTLPSAPVVNPPLGNLSGPHRFPAAEYSFISVVRGRYVSPSCAFAAWMVLESRYAIVIGPTPPGTGVIARARSAAGAN